MGAGSWTEPERTKTDGAGAPGSLRDVNGNVGMGLGLKGDSRPGREDLIQGGSPFC